VKSWYTAYGNVIFLYYRSATNLIYNYVKIKFLTQCSNFELTSPISIASHQIKVIINFNVIFHIKTEIFFVFLNVINCNLSKILMLIFSVVKLVRDCPKETVAITSNFFELLILTQKLISKNNKVSLILFNIKDLFSRLLKR